VKLTTTPPYCSSCFQQKPAVEHIDFESYWDGPIIEGAGFKQPIDDLILCEDCLRAAGELIGLSEHKKLLHERNELKHEVQQLRKYREDNEVRKEEFKQLLV
jgi:hypothetical protein